MNRSVIIKIVIILVILAVIFFLYAAFKKGGSQDSPDFVKESFSEEVNSSNSRTLRVLQNLEGIDFRESKLFDEISFKGLVDFSQELSPLPRGRNNPFAPTSFSETYISRGDFESQSPIGSDQDDTPDEEGENGGGDE